MPNPATGQGVDVSKGLQKFSWCMYMCLSTSAGIAPPNKLGVNEPAAPWVRMGRMMDDDIKWNVPDPAFLEGRAGFAKVLKFRAVNQAEIPIITASLDETDPDILNRLRGNAAGTATSLSSGVYLGSAFTYKPGVFVQAKVLFVGSGINVQTERQIYAANCYVTFKFTESPMSETVDAIVSMANDTNNTAFLVQDWT